MILPANRPIWSNAELMPRVLLGENDAFAELIDRMDPLIGSVLRKYLPDREVPDAKAEVHLHLWMGRKSYVEKGSGPGAWIARIARNYAIGWLRKHPHLARVQGLDDLDLPDPRSCATSFVEVRDWACLALAKLSPEDQELVNLRMAGKKLAEIATLLGRKPSRVFAKLRRIYKALAGYEV